MSASREKKIRKELAASGQLDPKQLREQEERAKHRRTNIMYGVIAGVFVLVAILLLLWNSHTIQRNITAVTIDGTKYSAADVDYYYHTVFNNLANNPYASYIGIGPNMNLRSAMSDTARAALGVETEGITWDAYLKNEAINNLKYVDALYKLAQKDGYTFTDDMQKDLDAQLEGLRAAAKASGVSESAYLKAQYGNNMTKTVFTKMWKQAAIASAYRADHQTNLTYTDADLEAYYADHTADLDRVSYEVIYFDGNPVPEKTEPDETATEPEEPGEPATEPEEPGEPATEPEEPSEPATEPEEPDETATEPEEPDETATEPEKPDETAELTDEEKAAAAKEAAHSAAHEALVRYNAGESLEDIAKDYDNATYNKVEAGKYSTSDVMKWLFDDERKDEEVTILETDPSCYLLLFHSRTRTTEKTVNVRHILFQFDTSSLDKNAETYEADLQAAKDAAKAKADDALAQWKAGEATEDSFAALANQLSEDPGSNTNGGLYEKVYPGQMVTSFNDWCMDESRKAGDTDVVETDYGYHVMYYSGDNVPYWKYIAENTLRNQDQQNWLEGLVQNITVTQGNGMKYVG